MSRVEAFVQQAKRMEGSEPAIVGYGITSDTIRDCTHDSLFAAVELAAKNHGANRSGSYRGFYRGLPRLHPSEERITINDKMGSVTYNKCDATGRPGDVEHNARIGPRVD